MAGARTGAPGLGEPGQPTAAERVSGAYLFSGQLSQRVPAATTSFLMAPATDALMGVPQVELIDRINQDLRQAMRDRDDLRRTTLRMLLSAVHNAEIAARPVSGDAGTAATTSIVPERPPLTEQMVQDVLRTQVKQRREAIDQFRRGSREELAQKEEAELVILSAYLPQQLARDEIAAEARTVIQEVGATGPADMRKVMPPLMERLRNRAEGRLVGEVVRELLAERAAS